MTNMWKTLRSLFKTPKSRQKWPQELVAANRALRSHISKHLTVLQRTENDILNFLWLLKSPELDKKGFRQLRELIETDQFLDCTFDEARNSELESVYEMLIQNATMHGARITKKRFKVHAETATIIAAIMTGFLAAAGLAAGVIVLSVGTAGLALPLMAIAACLATAAMPVIYDVAKPRLKWLGARRKVLDEDKLTCKFLQEESCTQKGRLTEVDIAMLALCASAETQSENIAKVMRGGGSKMEKTKKLWRMYRDPLRLFILNRHRETLSEVIIKFEADIKDLETDLKNNS